MDLLRHVKPLADRVQMMIGRAIVAGVDDAPGVQALQIELLADETHDDVERFQNYGFGSHPFEGAEGVAVFTGGLRSRGIVIAVEDRRYRMKLDQGEVAIFDDWGQTVHLKRDGIRIASDFKVEIEAPHVTVTSDDIHLGGSGGAKVARLGDTVSGGVITGGSDKVRAA